MKGLVIVDLDGTLVDTKDINFSAYKESLEKHGYNLDYNYFRKYCNGKHYLDFIPKIVEKTELFDTIHSDKKKAYSKYLDKGVVNKFLVCILETLRSEFNTALVTTASRQNCYELLRHFNLEEIFDIILTRDDIKFSKPNPEGFLKAMTYFHSTPETTIIFEDSNPGMEAALATGAKIYRTYGYN